MRRWNLFHIVFIIIIGSCTLRQSNNAAQSTNNPWTTKGSPTSGESYTTIPTFQPTLSPVPLPLNPTEITIVTSAPSDSPLPSGEAIRITTIHMISETSGWAIGHQESQHDHILRTFDGGDTWIDISPPEPLPQFFGSLLKATAYFIDNDYAWVVYTQPTMQSKKSAFIWYTSNGGIDWGASAPLPLTKSESFFEPEQFVFMNLQQGWLLVHVDAGMSHDYSEIFTTTDGGMHWERVSDPYTDGIQSLHNTGMDFADTQFGWVTKDNLGVLQETFLELTTDGGYSWRIHSLPAPNNFDWQHEISRCITSEPEFLSWQAGIVLVNCIVTTDITTFETKTLTYIYTTPNRGQSWQYTQLPIPIDSLFFIDEKKGWAFGREIFTTSDGGISWVSVKTVNWDGQFSFINSLHGWAVASNNEEIALVRTADGGLTWQILDPQIK